MTGTTRAASAYHSIKTRILRGEIPAGRVLTERALAEQAQISRTPLRAAIQRLEQEGIIARLSNGTLMVREVSLEQFMEINEVRRILEAAAARRAAELARDHGLHPRLASARSAMQRYVDQDRASFDAFWQDDDFFHDSVTSAAGFQLMPQMIRQMRETSRRGTVAHIPGQFSRQASEHLAVIDAIEAGDAEAAHAAMELHFDSVRQRLLGWLSRR